MPCSEKEEDGEAECLSAVAISKVVAQSPCSFEDACYTREQVSQKGVETMSEKMSVLIIMAGIAISYWVSNSIARKDFLSGFLWGMVGAIPGVTLLTRAPMYYMLLALPIIGAAIWRRIILRQRTLSS